MRRRSKPRDEPAPAENKTLTPVSPSLFVSLPLSRSLSVCLSCRSHERTHPRRGEGGWESITRSSLSAEDHCHPCCCWKKQELWTTSESFLSPNRLSPRRRRTEEDQRDDLPRESVFHSTPSLLAALALTLLSPLSLCSFGHEQQNLSVVCHSHQLIQ
jgi:hypothetical protein